MKYNSYQEAFEQKLNEYIAQSGFSQTWIAKKLGYHKSALNRWFNGEAQIPLKALKELCNLFKLERDECLELVKLAGYEDVLMFIEDDASIFRLFNQKAGALRRHIRVQEFQSLVDERTRDFVGRQFIFQAIDDVLAKSQTGGYIVIQGEPGIGKTALMAQLVKQRHYVHHFNIAIQNIRTARDFLANICAQLIVRYELAYPLLPPEATQDSGFLVQLLTEVAAKTVNQPLVILVDALDEVEDIGLPGDANRLLLPAALPPGVFFIITTREQADCRLVVDRREDIYLQDHDPRNLADVAQYIQAYIQRYPSEMAARMAEWGITADTFVQVMTDKSQGNFMYLVQVLRDICAGKLTAATMDNIYQLPQGLRGYYQRHWRLMRAQDETRFATSYEPVVCYLATAREPVNMEQLVEWTKLSRRQIKEVINAWREFLNVESGSQGEPFYHIYHASFQDFLKDEVGLNHYHDRIAQNALDKISNF